MIKEAIDKAVQKIDLSEAEMMAAMEEIMEGQATPAQIGSLITALRPDHAEHPEEAQLELLTSGSRPDKLACQRAGLHV